MPYQRLTNARKKAVGAKQTMKAVTSGEALAVYIASDAEPRITDPIVKTCAAKEIPITKATNMKRLGKACNIEVRCAVAAIIKD